MLKVAIVSPMSFTTDSRSIASVERLTSQLVDGLISQGDIEVTLFASGDSQTSAKLVPTIEKAFNRYGNPGFAAATENTVKEVLKRAKAFDVIHSHFHAKPTAKMVGQHGVPVLNTLHEHIMSSNPKKNPTRLIDYASIPYITPISDSMRIPHPSINYTATVYNGLNIEEFPFVSIPKGDEKGEYWFFMGRIHPEKGVYYAIRTALRHNRRLIIAGLKSNSKRRYFNEMIRPYLGEQIQYIGTLKPEGSERAQYMGNASLVLLPSCCDEAFGLVTVEALLCGTPILGTRRGAFPEIVAHGQTGYLAESNGSSVNEEELFSYALEAEALDRRTCRKSVEKKIYNREDDPRLCRNI